MQRTVIARWESRRGKDWVEVYEQTLGDGSRGCGYEARTCGGWLGAVTGEKAVADIAKRVEAGCFCSQKSPMRKVI